MRRKKKIRAICRKQKHLLTPRKVYMYIPTYVRLTYLQQIFVTANERKTVANNKRQEKCHVIAPFSHIF